MVLSRLSCDEISQLSPEDFRQLAKAHNAAYKSLTAQPPTYEDQRLSVGDDSALRAEVFSAWIDPDNRDKLLARLEGAKQWAESCRLRGVAHYDYDPTDDQKIIHSGGIATNV